MNLIYAELDSIGVTALGSLIGMPPENTRTDWSATGALFASQMMLQASQGLSCHLQTLSHLSHVLSMNLLSFGDSDGPGRSVVLRQRPAAWC